MMKLIQTQITQAQHTLTQTHLTQDQDTVTWGQHTPQVLVSWAALVAFEDLPQFSDLTGFPVEQLIQSLFYRTRYRGENLNKSREDVKVSKKRVKKRLN